MTTAEPRRRMTQAQIAEATGCTRVMVSMIAAGTYSYPDSPTARRVQKFLQEQGIPCASVASKPSRPQARQRACLRCGTEFASEGFHNRLCGPCRGIDPGPVAMAWARPQRRGEAARA